ncbi:MAG TPA: TetR/AcrR family transcriptional regulator [Chloroflexota bacterium]|nr:TetR/AcrR family transcriptional regulator [Chloroflexota bacterium]
MRLEPKTKRGQASRERIVEAAADLMFTRGVRATGLDDVLAAAGVGKGQFYHYFADKDALVRAVIARQSERILDGQRLMLEHLDSWAAIAAWFERMVRLQEQRGCVGGCPLGSLASELADQNEVARADLVATFDRWEGYLASGLERMRACGELHAEADPAVLAAAAMASIQGGLLLAQTRKDARALQRALDGAFAYLRTFAVDTPRR